METSRRTPSCRANGEAIHCDQSGERRPVGVVRRKVGVDRPSLTARPLSGLLINFAKKERRSYGIDG